MVLNVERQMVAAILQYPELRQRLNKAKISPEDLTDTPAKIILKAINQAAEYGEVVPDTVKKILFDSEMKQSDKTLYATIVDDFVAQELDHTEFSFSYFAKHKEEADLNKALLKAAEARHRGEDISKIKADLLSKLSQISNSDIEIKQYHDTLSKRERERHEIMSGEGMMKFPHELRHLQPYFKFGLAKETMTCIQGSTNAGKSVFLANLVWIATLPENKLNVLYVFSENREVEALSRLDAVVLGKPYEDLYKWYLNDEERTHIKTRHMNDHGRIFYLQPEFENFGADTIEQAIEQAAEQGFPIDILFVDSPDHMKPGKTYGQWFVDKPQVWKDLKALMHKYKIAVVGTWPLREEYSGQTKEGKEPPALTANSGAGGQDVARAMDNIIAFAYDERSDDLMNHRLFVVTKCRDGKRDFQKIRYRIMDNLRFIHAEDFNEQFAPRDLSEAFAPAES